MATIELNEQTAANAEVADSQTFAPTHARLEKPRIPGRSRQVNLISLENLPKYAKNRYEGVLIAAARARQLNAKKIAMEERGMEEAAELKRMKMTSHALNELVTGQIEVMRPDQEF